MRQRLSIAFLVAFVFVDVFLVTLAVRHTSTPPSPAASSPRTPIGSESSATEAPSPSDAGSTRAATLTAPTYLGVNADGIVLRSTRGSCTDDEAPLVSVSTDRGSTFADRTVPGLGEALRLTVDPDGSLSIVGQTTDCTVASWSSSDAGRKWARSTGAPGVWSLAPNPDDAAVLSPGGRRSTPCVPVGLSSIGTGVVRLLCDDGQILGTSDEGATWVATGRLAGAIGIRFSSPSDGVALGGQDGCKASVMVTSNGGTSWTQQKCLGSGTPLAIAATGDVVAVQRVDRFDVSTDAGDTWSRD